MDKIAKKLAKHLVNKCIPLDVYIYLDISQNKKKRSFRIESLQIAGRGKGSLADASIAIVNYNKKEQIDLKIYEY